MDFYKKIIRKRETRKNILRVLSFMPDRAMVELQYFIKTGRKLNLKAPTRFSEKLQWYKLYYRDPLMVKCVDKYDVREYVKEKGLEHILIPCIGVYNSVDEIDWESLPKQFVIKDTLGGGGGSVIIVKDKSKTDLNNIKMKADSWLRLNLNKTKSPGREWPYDCGKNHRIIIDEYVDSNDEAGGLIDYKFFCFYGKFRYMYIIADRVLGKGAGLGICDEKMNKLDVVRLDERPLTRVIPKPVNYDEMVKVASKLSEPFPESRIDLYNVDGKILFGEITFFDGSGYMKFSPDSFDEELGNCFLLPEKNN